MFVSKAGVSVRAAVLAGVLGMAAAEARAIDWIEPRSNDAGKTIAEALYPTEPFQVGTLDAIQGVLDAFGGFGIGGTQTDPQDLFAIDIVNPGSFSARAVSLAGSSLDTQLFLFSATGLGQLANDDFASFDVLPRLMPTAADGTFVLTTPGLYFLGIAGKGNMPVSGSASQIFSYATPTELSGPDGPGGGAPLTDWIGPETLGLYRIELTGCAFIPAPGAGSVLVMLGTLAIGRRRR